MRIAAIYKIPEVKHVFFIVSPDGDRDEALAFSLENKKENFGSILRTKGKENCQNQEWKLELVSQNDFSETLERFLVVEKKFPYPAFQNPANMELLGINLLKDNHPSSDTGYCKILSNVPDDDVIHVFI